MTAIRFTIEPMQPGDWREVRGIYAEGLATGLASFMRKPPLWKAWDAGQLPFGRLVARAEGTVLGWAALRSVADT
jgi:phosphinothricin acetyltransferase